MHARVEALIADAAYCLDRRRAVEEAELIDAVPPAASPAAPDRTVEIRGRDLQRIYRIE